MQLRTYIAIQTLAFSFGVPFSAMAQEDESVELGEEEEEEEPAEPTEAEEDVAAKAEANGDTDDATDDSPVELPGQTYYFVGARYRGIVVPKFMVNLFAEGGSTEYMHAIGPEIAMRRDGLEFNVGLWLAFYGMDDTAFKGKSDPPEAWEHVRSELKILYLTVDILPSHDFNERFSILYGASAGFGIVFGDLFRTQVYPGPDSSDDPNTWLPCQGVGMPNAQYCDDENDHFPGYTEPSWFGGGSKPVLFPWIALQTGLRYKPSAKFVGRLDLGFGTSGFFFGLGADYGL